MQVVLTRALVLLVSAMMLPVFAPVGSSHSTAQAEGPTVLNNVVMIIQGDNDNTPGDEADNEFCVLKILVVELPRNVTRFHTNVPANVTDLDVWSVAGQINSTDYGWESQGVFAGWFCVDVPSSHSRTAKYTNVTDSEAEFLADGASLTNLNCTSGALRLAENATQGVYTSQLFHISGAYSISSANLTVFGSALENISMELSNDNGTSWMHVDNTTDTVLPTMGTEALLRLRFEGNASRGYDLAVTKLQLSLTYSRLTTTFTVHMSYLLTVDFVYRVAALDVTEPLPYDSDSGFLLMFYVVRGFLPDSQAMHLTLDTSGTLSSYPNKDLYLNTSDPYSLTGPLDMSLTAPVEETPWALYLSIAGGVTFLMIVVFGSSMRKKRAGAPSSEGEAPADAEEMSAPEGSLEGRKREIVARKKNMLAEIEEVKAGAASGKLSRERAEADLQRFRNEFKAVRNELNRLSRKAQAPSDLKAVAGEYESVMAILAKLDDDFGKGRLPEGIFKSLRKEYVAKAAKLMAAREAAAAVQSPLESEKVTLMEAIVALDEEHQRGEIEDRVYEELDGSYRKELAELMKRIEDSG